MEKHYFCTYTPFIRQSWLWYSFTSFNVNPEVFVSSRCFQRDGKISCRWLRISDLWFYNCKKKISFKLLICQPTKKSPSWPFWSIIASHSPRLLEESSDEEEGRMKSANKWPPNGLIGEHLIGLNYQPSPPIHPGIKHGLWLQGLSKIHPSINPIWIHPDIIPNWTAVVQRLIHPSIHRESIEAWYLIGP